MTRAILLVAFDFTDAHEDEFHDWYDLEHLPERQRIPGFRACDRWIGVDNPRQAVATYELDSLHVLQSAAYGAVAHRNLSPLSKRVTAMCRRLLRFEGEQMGSEADPPARAGGLLLNAMSVAPEQEAEFNAWYDEEHIPALAAVPGTLCARRFRAPEGTPRYLALYHLEQPEVQASAIWRQAAGTPWTARMRPHFRDHVRIAARAYRRA